jgi:ABC-type antimicrobial peptide transport system ATPase subunit
MLAGELYIADDLQLAVESLRALELSQRFNTSDPADPRARRAVPDLDINHQVELLDLLTDLNRRSGKTIVLVLHDLNLACRYADHIVAMEDGPILAQGAPRPTGLAGPADRSRGRRGGGQRGRWSRAPGR